MQITYMIIRRRSSDAFQSSMRRSWDRGREATTTTITELTLLPEMGVIQVAFLAARFRVDAPTSTPTPLLMIRRASPVRIPPPVPLYLVVFFWGGFCGLRWWGGVASLLPNIKASGFSSGSLGFILNPVGPVFSLRALSK